MSPQLKGQLKDKWRCWILELKFGWNNITNQSRRNRAEHQQEIGDKDLPRVYRCQIPCIHNKVEIHEVGAALYILSCSEYAFTFALLGAMVIKS